jgi:hypothetical protein
MPPCPDCGHDHEVEEAEGTAVFDLVKQLMVLVDPAIGRAIEEGRGPKAGWLRHDGVSVMIGYFGPSIVLKVSVAPETLNDALWRLRNPGNGN